jgi:valyl-tRNA synthetase
MKKLGNPNFVERAAPAVIEEQRAKLAEAEATKARLETALGRLAGL